MLYAQKCSSKIGLFIKYIIVENRNMMVRAFGMNPKVRGSSTPQVETFSFSKICHFHKSIRSWVEN